ncbi:MAG TPA: sucrase ferredoxin [Pyrinomonadaceae bacterium]
MIQTGMGGHFYYCSELSLAAGEETFGTASGGEVWMLVEYPLAWGTKALEMSALPRVVKTHLSGLLKIIPRSRVLLIKQQSRSRKSSFSFFVVRTTEGSPWVARFELTQYEQLLRFDAATVVAAAAVPGADLSTGPLFLVCTHGRRDKCCAKFGYPLFKSLRRHAGASVWQSSHVGGDRFAANLVCFPHGLFYARVTEEAGRRILGEYEGGRVVLENYRGRACYANAVQAAEFFVRRESGLAGVNDLRLRGMTREGERTRRVRFETADGAALHEALITWGDSSFRNVITCHAGEERSVTQYALGDYRVERAASPLAKA